MTWLVRSIWPNRLVSKIARNASLGRSSTAPGMAKAPLLKTASMRPPLRASASAAASATEASSARSRGKLSRPSARSRSQSSAARQVAKTRQPRASEGAGRIEADSRRAAGDEDRAGHRLPATGRPWLSQEGLRRGSRFGCDEMRSAGRMGNAWPCQTRGATGNATPWIIHLDLKRDSLYLRRTLVWYFRWLRGVVMAEYGVGGGLCTSKCKANDRQGSSALSKGTRLSVNPAFILTCCTHSVA